MKDPLCPSVYLTIFTCFMKKITTSSPALIPVLGSFFLFLFWLIAYDGITFSDDVYYILAGRDFWNGTMEVNSYHFSTRWGAYILAGLMSLIFGFDPHSISFISLLAYLGSYLLLIHLLQSKREKIIFSIWFLTQVYFLHFLTKVYPDSILVFCCSLAAYGASIRMRNPIVGGKLLMVALTLGFLSKETIVFLFPLPLILLYIDWKGNQLKNSFYITFFSFSILAAILYLGFFWAKFGDPLYRIHSINAGHYVSEFTYADKGWTSILKRLTVTPIFTLVERAYWPWLVFALPGIYVGFKKKESGTFEFSLIFMLLLLGFWFMTSTLEFYNPIYLNPRHLIILVPIMAFLIAKGWNIWNESKNWKWVFSILLGFGAIYSMVIEDRKMITFSVAFIYLIWSNFQRNHQWKNFAILLFIPAIASAVFQFETKRYRSFTKSLETEVEETQGSPILVNNFVFFSKEVLLNQVQNDKNLLIPIEKSDSVLQTQPENVRVLIYNYYQHAYPQESEDVETLEALLKEHFELENEREEGLVEIREFRKK